MIRCICENTAEMCEIIPAQCAVVIVSHAAHKSSFDFTTS